MLEKDKSILKHIISYCDKIDERIQRFGGKEEFLSDDCYRDACIMCVIQIGELVTQLSDEIKAELPNIPWRDIKDTRNFYVHSYGKLNNEQVWEVITDNLPYCKEEFKKIISNDLYEYKIITEKDLETLQKQNIKFDFRVQKDKKAITIRYLKDDADNIKKILSSKNNLTR